MKRQTLENLGVLTVDFGICPIWVKFCVTRPLPQYQKLILLLITLVFLRLLLDSFIASMARFGDVYLVSSITRKF